MKRILLTTINLIICLTLIMGCTQTTVDETSDSQTTDQEQTTGESSVNPAGILPIVDETVTLTALAVLYPDIEDVTTNYATLWLEEKTNVHINWEVVGQDDAQTKINLIIAAGTNLPDMILNGRFDQSQQMQYGAEGIFIPLNDLIEEYAVNLKKEFEQNPKLKYGITTFDGNIYGWGAIEVCFHCNYSQKMWINQTWLDTLGLETPKTTDDFYNVLKAFKEEDPNQTGADDVIPLSGTPGHWRANIDGFLMNPFIYNDGGNRLNLDNGTVIAAFVQPEWREGLAYLSKLYSEGLMDAEVFTQGWEQLQQLVEGDVVRLGASPGGIFPGSRDFVSLAPLEGPTGQANAGYYPDGVSQAAQFVITNACENPEVAIRWADFLLDEEANFIILRGEEGVDWRRGEEGEVGLDGNPAVWEHGLVDYSAQQNKMWHDLNPHRWALREGLGGVVDPDNPWESEFRLYNASLPYVGYEPDEVIANLRFHPDVITEYSELRSIVNEYVNEHIARFVSGDLDINSDSAWEMYLNEFTPMGLERYVEIVQEAYNNRQ